MLSVLTFRTPAEAVEKANNTPYGLSAGIWTEKGSRILWMADQLRAGVVWANTFNKFDPTSPFGGYKESGYGREGGRHGLEAYLDADREARRLTAAGRRAQDLQALHRRRVPAQRVRPVLRGDRRQGRVPRQRGAGLAQGRPRRGRRGPQGVRRAGPARPRTTAARSSTGSPSCWRAGAASSSTRSPRPRACRARRPRRGRRRRDRPLGLVRRLGRQARPGARRPTRSPGPYFNLSAPEPTGVVARPRAAGLLAARPGLRASRRRSSPATPCVVLASETRPLPAITLAEVLATSDVPGGVVNILTGRVAEIAPWLASHMDVNALDLTGAADADAGRASWRSRRPTTSSGCCRPDAESTGRADPGLEPDDRPSWRPRRSGTRSASEPRAGNRAGRAHAALRHLGHALPA